MPITSRIAARFSRLFTRPAVQVVPPGWQPIMATDPADVFIVAYPKSGITWLQNMVAATLYGLDPQRAPDSLVQELVPDVHYKQLYKRFRTPMVFKTHHLPRPEYRRVVYLLRDGRDVMVSYWHHLEALDNGESFTVNRNGVPVGELVPVRRRLFVAAETAAAAYRGFR